MLSSHVHTRHVHDSFQTHACNSEVQTPNLNYVCMQTVGQGQQNKLYEHVYVLRCDSPCDTSRKCAKEFLIIKLKQLGDVFYRLLSVILR